MKCCLLGILAITMTGCATHYIQYTPKTEPPVTWVYPEGSPRSYGSYYRYRVTQTDRDKGEVVLPRLVFEARGHKPEVFRPAPFKLDSGFWSHSWNDAGNVIHGYENTRKVVLTPDANYEGPETPNKLTVRVNSEPAGARVYQNGKLVGTTPYDATYELDNRNYQFGQVNCTPLIAAAEGYLPVEFKPVIPIDRDWKYSNGRTFESTKAVLFLLRRDPNDQRPIVVQQGVPQPTGPQTVVIKQDPHYGREWETGMRALGEAIRPYSKADPVTTEQSIRSLQGYGTLIDLMNR